MLAPPRQGLAASLSPRARVAVAYKGGIGRTPAFSQPPKVLRQPSPGPSESFQQQLERRRRAQYAELAVAVAEVDVDLFTREAFDTGGQLDPSFEVRGALPPTTTLRCEDPLSARELTRGDREAARQIISERQEAESRELQLRVQSAREDRIAVAMPQVLQRGGPRPTQAELDSMSREEAKLKAKEDAHVRVGSRRFEVLHKQREAALVSAQRTAERRAAHQHYRERVADSLLERRMEKEDERFYAFSRRQQERQLNSARKSAREAMGLFTMQAYTADAVCRKMDLQEARARQSAAVSSKVALHRHKAAVRTAQFTGQHMMIQAQQDRQRTEERERVRQLANMERQRQAIALAEQRTKIRAKRELAKVLQAARQEITAREEAAAASANDVAGYEQALQAFQDLAGSVSSQCDALRKRMQGLRKADTAKPSGQAAGDEDEDLSTLFSSSTRSQAESGVLSDLTKEDKEALDGIGGKKNG